MESDAKTVMSRVAYETWRKGELEKVRPLAHVTLEVERAEILRVIDLCNGNRAEAAMRLGIGRVTLYRRLGQGRTKP